MLARGKNRTSLFFWGLRFTVYRAGGCEPKAESEKAGATKEEIAEALSVAVSLNAGTALVYLARALAAAAAVSAD